MLCLETKKCIRYSGITLKPKASLKKSDKLQ